MFEKSTVFLYTGTKIKNPVLSFALTITSKKMKYIQLKLIKHVKDLQAENYTMKIKQIEVDLSMQEGIFVHGLEDSKGKDVDFTN